MTPAFFRNALALFAVAVACQDSQEPAPQSLSDPQAVSTELAQIDSAIESETFQSYRIFSTAIVGPLTGALPLAGSTVQAMVAELRGPLLPDSALGTTYEWDTDTTRFRYIPTARPGAPTNGVRFIVYVRGPSGGPAEPRVELGYIDFMDESSGNTLRLHVRLRSSDGAVTYFEYTATIVQGNFTASVAGTIHNGLAGPTAKTLTFTASTRLDTRTSQTSYTLSAPSLGVTYSDRLTSAQGVTIVDFDFRLSRPGEVVRLTGNRRIGAGASSDVAVTVNGGIYARGTGNVLSTTWTKHDNSSLTGEEVRALNDLNSSATFTFFFLTFMFQDPIEAALDP